MVGGKQVIGVFSADIWFGTMMCTVGIGVSLACWGVILAVKNFMEDKSKGYEE